MLSARSTLAASLAGLALVASACNGDEEAAPRQPQSTAETPAEGEIGRNVARIPGQSAADVAGAAVLAAYPPGRARPPRGWIFLRRGNWQEIALGAQFAARPVNGGLLFTEKDYFPQATADLITRMKPQGFPRGDGLQALIVGKAGGDVILDLQDQNLELTQLAHKPDRLSRELVPFRGGWARVYSDTMILVSSEERDFALPAAAWSAYSGDTLAFVGRDSVPDETIKLLVQRKKVRLETPSVYLVGSEDVISSGVAEQLSRYARVHRIDADDPVEASVDLAAYRDRKTGFGWGLKKGPVSASLVNVNDWGNSVGAFTFAAQGPQAPLILTDNPNRLPATVVRYLRNARSADEAGHGFVFGDKKSISSEQLLELDAALVRKPL